MSSEWSATRLRDLVSIKHGFAFKGEFFVDEETPLQLTTPGNFAIGGGFQYGKGKYYAGPVPSDYVLQTGDLIVTMTDLSKAADTLGYAAVVPNGTGTTWLHNQRVGLVRPQEGVKVHMGYIHYLMRSPDYRRWVVSTATGSTVKHTSPDRILSYEFLLPSLAEQREIGETLATLDDRITLLRETNATLEAIAQALFKSWFVDFDPVRAKAEGRQPEGMDATTAALFPDSFEESELGLVPKGWRIGTVDDLCSQITNGGTPSRSRKDFWEGGSIPWFKTGEFCDGFLLEPSERITDEGVRGSSVKLLPKDSVLMAIYAAPTVGRLGVLTEPSAFNQACTGMVAKDSVGAWFLFLTLYFGRDWFNSRANGAAQQNISKAIVAGYSVVIPDDNVLKSFNETAESLFSRIRAGTVQAQTLTQLRDTLLPRLISGQLRLPEVQALLNDRDTAQ